MTAPSPPEIHPDLAAGPHVVVMSVRMPVLMAQAIKSRALSEGRDYSFILRELVRAGAPALGLTLDGTGR
jgi:hypothetical protein